MLGSKKINGMNLNRRHIVAFRLSLLAALIGILYLATTPQPYPVLDPINDKFKHLLAFYVLGLLIDFSFPDKTFCTAKIVSILGYALLIEAIQYFLPYRTASVLDLAADALGLVLYAASIPMLRHVPVLQLRWPADR
jgi:VanZ family protein